MKIKLDENMPQALAGLLRAAGHDAETVPDENLSGAEDVLCKNLLRSKHECKFGRKTH